MSKHTEGPWTVNGVDRNGQAIVTNAHIEIATCWHHCVGSIEKEMWANAHLIAAAPELLASLKLAMDHIQMLEEGIEELRQLGATAQFCGVAFSHEQAFAALAKAEGRTAVKEEE